MNRALCVGMGVVWTLIWFLFADVGRAMPEDMAVRGPAEEVSLHPTRNPFADTPAMRPQGGAARSTLLPAGAPNPRLRGYIENENGNAVALLEIQDGVLYVVRAGDTMSLRVGQQVVELIVEQIGDLSVWIRMGQNGPVMEIR